jgi:transposase
METTMAWTEITRPQYRRDGLRHASNLSEAEWAIVAPFLPPPCSVGRPREVDLREIVNAILFIAATGCQWRQLPREFSPYSTVQGYFYAWRDKGLWASINHALVMEGREQDGREASPTAGVIDSQSVKTSESGGPRGFDAGKKINGRKRHIVVDTQGHLVGVVVHAANIQDRDSAPLVLASIRTLYPWLRHVFADAGYAGDKLKHARPDKATGRSKLSNDRTPPRGSSCSRGDGSSSALSPGSAVADASPRTSRPRSKALWPGSMSLTFDA